MLLGAGYVQNYTSNSACMHACMLHLMSSYTYLLIPDPIGQYYNIEIIH